MQSYVRFNRVLEKVPEKFPGSLDAKPSQVQRVSEKVAEKVRRGFENLWARSGLTGLTGFPALGLAARFRKICKTKTLRLLGIPPKLISRSRYVSDFHEDLISREFAIRFNSAGCKPFQLKTMWPCQCHETRKYHM